MRAFRRKDYTYRLNGRVKPIRYSLVIADDYERYVSTLAELKYEIGHRERIYAEVGKPTRGTWMTLRGSR